MADQRRKREFVQDVNRRFGTTYPDFHSMKNALMQKAQGTDLAGKLQASLTAFEDNTKRDCDIDLMSVISRLFQ